MASSRVWPLFALFAAALRERATTPPLRVDDVAASAPSILETDARAMVALEDEGLLLSRILGASSRTNDALAKTDAWSTLHAPTQGAVFEDGSGYDDHAEFPAAGYEDDCFTTANEPIEKCITRHLVNRTLKTCTEDHACRDDYACARMIGLPPRTGVCVPTYFVYGLRVDGPLLDR